MLKNRYNKYNSEYQRFVKNKFLDSLPENDDTPETYKITGDFETVLIAPEQYENDKQMRAFIENNPDCSITEAADYFDEITPPGLPPHAEEWDDEDE